MGYNWIRYHRPQPNNIKLIGKKTIVEGFSASQVRKALKGKPGIVKIYALGKNECVIIHTLNKNNYYELRRMLEDANLVLKKNKQKENRGNFKKKVECPELSSKPSLGEIKEQKRANLRKKTIKELLRRILVAEKLKDGEVLVQKYTIQLFELIKPELCNTLKQLDDHVHNWRYRKVISETESIRFYRDWTDTHYKDISIWTILNY